MLCARWFAIPRGPAISRRPASNSSPEISAIARRSTRLSAGVETVYHIAAVYRQAGISKDTYRAVNAIAAGEIVEAAARAGVRRVVHCSTVGVHGDVEHPPANEEAPLKPGDIYQVDEARRRGDRARERPSAGHRGDHCPAHGHLRSRRSAIAQAVSGRRPRPVPDSRSRRHLLSPDLHRRSRGRIPPLRRASGCGQSHLHPRRGRGHDAEGVDEPHCGRCRRSSSAAAPARLAVLDRRRGL